MDELIGQRLGQYDILSRLGEGGMAVVYRARQASVERDVAIKIIHSDLLASKEFLARFQLEARTTASLSHPHIRKVFDYGQHAETLYLVSELIEGGTLAEVLKQGPLSLEMARRVLTQLASALDYAHGRGVIHRDLKPQNVLIDGVGNVFLTDFGLARLLTENLSLTQESALLGTPFYMSPEQWRGETADARTDNYGLAVMLYEMLAGSLPFTGTNQYLLMQQHLHESPPSILNIRPDLPDGIDDMFNRALAKKNSHRFATAMELVEVYQSLMQTNGLLANTLDAFTPRLTADFQVQANPALSESVLISLSQAADQERHAIRQLEADRARQPRTTPTRHRFVNALPQDVSGRFIGRVKQQADIAALLTAKTRLISICGRSGIGKTALACKVLGDLQADQDGVPLDGMVYLSARTTGISLDRIYADIGKLLDSDSRQALATIVHNKQIAVPQKTVALLEMLGEGRYVLLLDNLEAVQDAETGKLSDADLDAFFETVLEHGGALCIVITSREPLTLSRRVKTWERLVPLEEGLPLDDSAALLRLFDPDGAASLRDAADEQLQVIADKAHGYPRALETIAGLLLEDPLIRLDDLIRDVTLLTGEITPIIVQAAISHLSPAALRIMEALAVLDRPVPQSAIEFLLAPYMDTLALRTTLARLVRAYFVSFDKANQTFSLHTIDREYFYSRLPEGSSDDKGATRAPYTRNALHYRAADYYRRQRKPRDQARSVEDLAPQVAEVEHLMQAGDYDTASELLLTFGDDYLHI